MSSVRNNVWLRVETVLTVDISLAVHSIAHSDLPNLALRIKSLLIIFKSLFSCGKRKANMKSRVHTCEKQTLVRVQSRKDVKRVPGHVLRVPAHVKTMSGHVFQKCSKIHK